MSFPNDPKVIYILVSIKLDIGNDMDQGHYVCDVLDYNTGTWWNCDDEKVTPYPGYPMNLYNVLSLDKSLYTFIGYPGYCVTFSSSQFHHVPVF